MKSLAELKALRDKARGNMGMREDAPDNTRIVVGMATRSEEHTSELQSRI